MLSRLFPKTQTNPIIRRNGSKSNKTNEIHFGGEISIEGTQRKRDEGDCDFSHVAKEIHTANPLAGFENA